MCRSDSLKPNPGEEKEIRRRNENIHSPFYMAALEFRHQTDNSSQLHNLDEYIRSCCHALPCTIHGTSKYANVPLYFKPTPYNDDYHFVSDVCIDKDVVEEKNRSVTNKKYLCAQFRGRGIMTETSNLEIDGKNDTIMGTNIGLPIPSNMAGVILSKSNANSNQYNATSLEVETTFRTMLEWRVASDVEQMEQQYRNKKSRVETVKDWAELGASVS